MKRGHEPGMEREGTVTCKETINDCNWNTNKKENPGTHTENAQENATASGAEAHQKNREGKCFGKEKACPSHKEVDRGEY